MSNDSKYIVVQEWGKLNDEYDKQHFLEKVNKKLSEGYSPIGNVRINGIERQLSGHTGYYLQAMINHSNYY